MNDIFAVANQTINNVLSQNPFPEAEETLHAHLELLNAPTGSPEENMRKLVIHTNQRVLDILEEAGPNVDGHALTTEQVHVMSAHLAVGNVVATLLQSTDNP